MFHKKSKFAFGCMLFGYAFLYIPLCVLIFFSFNGGKQISIWGGFSLKWYHALFENDALIQAGLISLKIAMTSATLATLLGTFAALIIVRIKNFKGKKLFNSLLILPLVMPEIIMGLAFLLLFINMENVFGFTFASGIPAITVAHATISMAYIASIIKVQLEQLDPTLIEAAQDLGASPLKAFFVITLPIIMPSLFAGWLLAFILSLDDVVMASFLSGPESNTLPMLVFSSLRFGITPQLNALATIIIFTIAAGIFLSSWIQLRKKK